MNSDLEKNVLQYSNELQRLTQKTEQNLLKIQNDKIKEFRNNLNNISNNCISDIQLLINKTHSKVTSNLSKNKIDDTVLDGFQFSVQAIILQAKNDLDTYKNQFDIDISENINEEILKLKTFIKENHGSIESELHDALYQINQSENSALNRLEETYDLGVETIVSAERTALRNLKVLAEELSIKLEDKVEEIENVINEKLQNALDSIKDLEDEAIANITKLEITIKNELQVEKENIIAELRKLIEDFQFTLDGYVEEMKAELTAHKDKLLEEITINKEEIFIELEKVKNGIIETLREKEYEIIQNLNNRAQEIISEIVSVVDGFDLELEIIKTAKIQEFVDAINSIKEQALGEIVDIIEDCINELNNVTETHKSELFNETAQHLLALRNQCLALIEEMKQMCEEKKDEIFEAIEEKGEDVIGDLLDNAILEVQKYVSNLKEQRYITTLPAFETLIQLPKDFTLNDRVKLYIDGILHLPDDFCIIDKLNRTITLNNPYEYSTDIFVTADMPDANIQALKDQLYIDGNRFVNESLKQIIDSGKKELSNIISNAAEQNSILVAEGIKQRDNIIQISNQYLTNIDNSYLDKSALLEKSYTEYLEDLTKFYSEYDSDLSHKYDEYLNEILKVSSGKITEITLLSQNKIDEINSLSSKHITLLNQTFENLQSQFQFKLDENLIILENKAQDCFLRIDKKVEDVSNNIIGKVNQAYKDIDKHVEQSIIDSKDNIALYVKDTIKPDIEIHGQLKVDEYINHTTKPEITRYTEEYVDNYLQNYIQPELNLHTENLKEELNEYKEDCKEDITNKKEELVEDSKNEIKKYIENFSEGYFNYELEPNETVIQIPNEKLILNSSVKVYVDGILLIKNKQYTINLSDNSIVLLEGYSNKIEVLLLQNLPASNSTTIWATDEQIDALFK